MNFQAVVSFYGIKQFFEVMNGAKFFFNGIACFMLLREIAETDFSGGLRNRVPMRKAGLILKAINLKGVYGGEISAGSQALILTLLLFWLICFDS